mgnify:CR=1 FL=1
MEQIKFGTDGWRAVIGETYTFENVRRVAKALALSLKRRGEDSKPVVIGYDFRFMSEYFARAVYDELTTAGITAQLSERPVPTPALSLAVKQNGASCGVMITASHNPHFYNGIKFKADYGGPVMPDFTDDVQKCLEEIEPPEGGATVYDDECPVVDILTPYLKTLKEYADLSKLKKANLRVAVDSMNAVGGNILPGLLHQAGVEVVAIRTDRNPLFDYSLPEPDRVHISKLSDLVVCEECNAGMATDGDADRIGVVDEEGEFVTLHYLMPMLYEYLCESREMKGDAVRTTSTDNLFDKVCESRGSSCIEVPVGFKNVCEVVLEKDIVVGGEESGGICFKGHIPERDGILTALLILEMMAVKGMSLSSLVNEMSERFHPVAYLREDRIGDQETIQRNMKQMKTSPPEEMGGFAVSNVDLKDGIKFYFENGAWMLMRVSQTEPKGRVYVGGPDIESVKRILNAGCSFLFDS